MAVPKPTIIIGGLSGSGKSTIARRIAKKFGLTYFAGGDALKEMAVKKGFKPGGADWWESAEGRRFLAERARNSDFDKEVDRIMLEKAREGGCVLTTRTLPYIGAPGIKIWLAVSEKVRAKRLAGRDRISEEEAIAKNEERDKADADIYKRLYGFELGDLSPFDLVVDTDKLNVEQTEKIVAEFVTKRLKERVG